MSSSDPGLATALTEESERREVRSRPRLARILDEMEPEDREKVLEALAVRHGTPGYIANEPLAYILKKYGYYISPTALWKQRKVYQGE